MQGVVLMQDTSTAFPRRSPLLSVGEVAEWLNVSSGWVYDHAIGRRRPVLPSVKLGKALRFHEDEVNAWLHARGQGKAA
jgi:excisionase family DNA binding protein